MKKIYILTESEKKITEKIVKVVKDVVNTVDPKEIYKRGLSRKKLVDKKVKAYESKLTSIGVNLQVAKKEIEDQISDFSIKKIVLTIKKYYKERVSHTLQGRQDAWNLFFYVILAYLLSSLVGVRILGISPKLMSYLNIIIGAPLIEEFARYWSIKKERTEEFWYVFNLMEFSQYVIAPVILFILGKASIFTVGIGLIVRYIAVMMHTFNTMVQESELKQGNKYRGYIIGVLVHFIWNFGLGALAGNQYNLRSLLVSGIGGIGLLKLVGAIYEKILNKGYDTSSGTEPAYA